MYRSHSVSENNESRWAILADPQRLHRLGEILCTLALITILESVISAGAQTQETGIIRGTVSFQDKPLGGVIVVALSPNLERRTSLTGPAGDYEIGDLRAGIYLVTVANTPYILTDGIGEAFKQMEVKGNSVTQLDLTLASGGVLAGCVQYSSGQPVVEREVIYEKADMSLQGFQIMSFRPGVVTDDRGCFRIYGLPAGQYRIAVGKTARIGITNLALPFATTYYPGVRSQSQADIFGLSSGQEYNLGTLLIKDGLNTFLVKGRFAGQDNGEGVGSFPFDLMRYDERHVVSMTRLRTDEVGGFKLEDLSQGHYRIQPAATNKKSLGYTFSPVTFDVQDSDINEMLVTCTPSTAGVNGEVVINNMIPAESQDCTMALKEGEGIDANNKTVYRITLDHGKFNLSGLNRATYTLVVMPLRPSLQYQRAEIGSENVGNSGAYGILRLDLTSQEQSVRIFLTEQGR